MAANIGLDPQVGLHNFLVQHLTGYGHDRPEVQQCAQERLLKLYANATVGDCLMCPYVGVAPNFTQALGDIMFTRGAQLASSTAGAQRYRYILDVEDAGGVLGATHAVDLCYFFPKPSEGTPIIPGICQWAQWRRQIQTGKVLRDYWASFAKTGKPWSAEGPAWFPVESARSGLPFLRLKLGGKGVMSDAAYFSDAAAELLGGIVCKEVALRETAGSGGGGCELIDARTGVPWRVSGAGAS
mmetsp:Transcript_42953/g.109166  ORF Transcript_42953/g.109166 Transcript_42953/m.109166 type:complete len:241 (+) Transcript_42953:2-724(+)